MRRIGVWILPACALLLLSVGLADHFLSRPASPASRARPGDSSRPDADSLSRLPTFDGAPTNEPPKKPKTEEAPPASQPVPYWRHALLTKDTRHLQAAMAGVLDRWGETRAEVLRLAEHDPDGLVRANAINLLVVKKEAGLVDFFAERLRLDPNLYVRRNCCRALGTFGGKRHLGLLRSALSDPEPLVSEEARKAIAALGETP